MKMRMITSNCCIVRLFFESIAVKSGLKLKYSIGLWSKRKVRIKDLFECTVRIGTVDLNAKFNSKEVMQ